MSDKNSHRTVASETIRRGGRAKRATRIMPENIDGAVDQLRERNKRTNGGHPIIPSKAWWQKTAGTYSSTTGEQPDSGRGAPGWKVTKMELGWNTLPQLHEEITQHPPSGEDEVDVASLHLNQGAAKSLESKFLLAQVDPRNQSGGKTSAHQFVAVKERKADDARQRGSPAAPIPPNDLQECDLTAMWGKADRGDV